MPERVSFNEHIRPILSSACYACHGPDDKKMRGDLQLHLESKALEWAIEPGKPDESVLIERINAADEDERMPPADSGTVLSLHQRKLLEQWIAEGAQWDAHWSLIPPRRTQPPRVRNSSWVRNNYDQFVLRRLEQSDLEPAPEVSKSVWLRRVTLDLTGLPPTLEDLDAFCNDTAPDGWSGVVDRLLATDACAENLTLKWLDNARFADSNGYQYDGPNNQWPWRDWVLAAFKANMPFDEFVTAQLAGDLAPGATLEQKIPTAFNRNHGFTIEGGVTPEEYRVQYVNDRVVTFGTVFLGLTMECARCHDHKFDEVSMEDFYSLSSFFDNIPGSGFWGGGLNTVATPVVRLPTTDPDELANQLDVEWPDRVYAHRQTECGDPQTEGQRQPRPADPTDSAPSRGEQGAERDKTQRNEPLVPLARRRDESRFGHERQVSSEPAIAIHQREQTRKRMRLPEDVQGFRVMPLQEIALEQARNGGKTQ